MARAPRYAAQSIPILNSALVDNLGFCRIQRRDSETNFRVPQWGLLPDFPPIERAILEKENLSEICPYDRPINWIYDWRKLYLGNNSIQGLKEMVVGHVANVTYSSCLLH
jgi:hypothetical protein